MRTEHLVGKWVSDPDDVTAIREYGSVSLDFSRNGTLVYSIHANEKREIIFLAYSIEDDELVTDQPSAPKRERTKINLDSDGRLRLRYGNQWSIFVRDSG